MQLELTKIKMEMLCNPEFTFFTTLLFALEIEEDSSIPTACTNGQYIKVNPDFWNGLVKPTRIGLLLHEVMHVALNHNTRLGDREPRRFNHACDYAINYDLIKAGYKLPAGGLYDEKYKGMTAEQIYDLLPDNKDYEENDLVYSDCPELADQIDKLLMGAAAAAKIAGKNIETIPSSAQRRIDELKNPMLPWEVLYQDKLLSHSENDYSMQFPDEEYIPDLYVPTLYSEGMGDLSFSLDVSASVSQNDLDIALSEINGCRESLSPKKLTVVSFDTKIHFETTYDKYDWVDMEGVDMKGGGGTSVTQVYKHIKEHQPELAVIITDGCYQEEKLECNTNLLYLIIDNLGFTTSNGDVIHISTKDY